MNCLFNIGGNGLSVGVRCRLWNKNFNIKTKFDMENNTSINHENGNDANRLLSAGVQYPSLDEMALKKAREIIDKFNEFDVFCEACEMADYMATEILDIGVIKYYHKPTSDFWVKVREHIRIIAKSNGRDW